MTREWSKEEEATRLRARFVGVNQARFARTHGLPGGPSMLSQHIHGHRPMNLEHAIVYATGFGVTLAEISPRLAKTAQRGAQVDQTPTHQPAAPLSAMEPPAPFSPGLTRSGILASLDVIAAGLLGVPDTRRLELRQRFAEFVDAPDSQLSMKRLAQLLCPPLPSRVSAAVPSGTQPSIYSCNPDPPPAPTPKARVT